MPHALSIARNEHASAATPAVARLADRSVVGKPCYPWRVAPLRYTIALEADVYRVRQAAERLALAEGYPKLIAHELALITSELAWNIVRHAGHGEIDLAVVLDPEHGTGVEIRAHDGAPPIADLALAQRDGHTAGGRISADAMHTRRGIGSGLGAVARLGDRFEQLPEGAGKCLVVTRFLSRPRP